MKRQSLIILLLSIVATACLGGRYRYSGYREIPVAGWAYNDSLTYDISLSDSIETGQLFIDISHDNFYPYSNLWVEVSYPLDSIYTVRDTYDIRLCDPSGRWYGKGIEGLYQLEAGLASEIILRDSSTVTVRHIMRVDTLRGISRIGISFQQP